MAEKTLFQRFTGFFGNTPTEEETKQMGNILGVHNVTSEGKNYKYGDLAKEGYLSNAIVYRCVNEISKGVSSVPFMIKNRDEEIVEQHPVIEVLKRPNPLQSYSEFFNSLIGYLMLSGNAYILKVGGENRPPQELHLLRPDRIEIKGEGRPIPNSYQYKINGKMVGDYAVDPETGTSDLKHIKLWNPLDDYYGLSPLSAAAVEIDQHNLASKHNINLLDNGARPSGAIIFKPTDETGVVTNLSESQRQQLKTDLKNRFTGANNAGRPLLLEGDFDWKEMGLSPKDMDFLNLKNMSATDIAMCFGVPSQLVGVPDAQTYNNVQEARLGLYEETIIPLLKKLESDLNEWLIPMYGDDIHLHFNIDDIPALSERRRLIYANVTNAVAQGIMTRNEARERLGLTPLDGADDLYISATLFPLGAEAPEVPEESANEKDIDIYSGLDEKSQDVLDTKKTNFPTRGDDEKISLRNSKYRQFDYEFAKNVKEGGAVGKKIWDAGGNIRGDTAFVLWGRARKGEETTGVLNWIKEREAWSARHTVVDGNQFVSGSLEPNLSNVKGVVALMKWGSVNPKLGISGMKAVILELTKKLEGRKESGLQLDEEIPDTQIKSYAWDKLDCKAPKPSVSARIKKALEKKVSDHNDKYGDNKTKRATYRMLSACFLRGVGAYYSDRGSVRPGVTGPDQWGLARVNSLLFVLRTGRFQGGQHDRDLLPKGHPKSTKD